MKEIKELQKIATETTCTMFSLNVTPTGQWKMYIFQSKIVFIDTLENVCSLAINEFIINRKAVNVKQANHSQANINTKCKYTGKPKLVASG